MRHFSSRCPASIFPVAFHGHPDFLMWQMHGLPSVCGLPSPTVRLPLIGHLLMPHLLCAATGASSSPRLDVYGRRGNGLGRQFAERARMVGTRSPRFDLHVSAVFFEGAAYLIVFAFWAGAPRWVGVVLFVALLATETCCSRSPSSGRKLPRGW